jgi:hypothetical protein
VHERVAQAVLGAATQAAARGEAHGHLEPARALAV